MENVITQIDSQVTKELMAPAKRLYFIFGLIGLVSTAAIVVAINFVSGAAAVSMLLFVTGAMLIGGGGGWVVLIVAERRQNKRYGSKKEYQDYVAKTPILLPLLPIYHLTKENGK